MGSRDGLPRGALPSGILKIEKYCPGLKVPVSFLPLLTSNIDFQFETDNDKGCRIAGVSVTVGLNILFAVIGWF